MTALGWKSVGMLCSKKKATKGKEHSTHFEVGVLRSALVTPLEKYVRDESVKYLLGCTKKSCIVLSYERMKPLETGNGTQHGFCVGKTLNFGKLCSKKSQKSTLYDRSISFEL